MVTTYGIYLYSSLQQRLLLCHATRSRNSWSIPKGLKEEGETDIEAAYRELFEECGISADELKDPLIHPLPLQKYMKQNKYLCSFLLVSNADLSDKKLKCISLVNGAFPEVDKYKWVEIPEFRELAHESQVKNLNEIERIIEQRRK